MAALYLLLAGAEDDLSGPGRTPNEKGSTR
jgi:hypothetical protein